MLNNVDEKDNKDNQNGVSPLVGATPRDGLIVSSFSPSNFETLEKDKA